MLGGGLTMDGIQAERTLNAVRQLDPALEARWRALYTWEVGGKPSYGPPRTYSAQLGLTIRELCAGHGLMDRMPRYIAPGPMAANKRIADLLFLKTYNLELEEAKEYRIWTYRKAAWTVDEWPENIVGLYKQQGEVGLLGLPGIGKSVAAQIARWIRDKAMDQQTETGVQKQM